LKHARGAARVHEPDDQQLSPLGAGLRGAREPRVFGAQPFCGDPHSGQLRQRESPRVEFRCPDPLANPYYAFSGDPHGRRGRRAEQARSGPALDKNIYDLPPEEAKGLPRVPSSLDEALRALDADHDFLLKGDVFTEDVIQHWIKWKYDNEVQPLRARPHPYEFFLYFDY
jgi:glutamine synthetase